ncbi:MAG: RNA-binding protein, partial [Acidobacteria bacterium]
MTNPCNRIKRNRGSAVEFGFVRDRLLASGVALVVVLVSVPAQPDDAVRFTDVTAASHIAFVHRNSAAGNKYLIETMTGGVALLDFDADGWLDVFLVNGAALRAPHTDRDRLDKSAPEFWNRLFRNNRDGTFTDVTERAGVAGRGYGMGAAVGDYDNDGFPDLYVTNYGDSILYHNNGDGTFTDVTARAGVKTEGWTTSAGFFDFDNDGDLDLFVCRYLRRSFANHVRCSAGDGVASYCHPDRFEPVSNYLFRNNGDGTFTDASRSSGIAASPGKGLGVAFADFDGDGRIDVSVANDSHPQSLFRNNGDGTFREVAFESGVAYTDEGKTFSGMGTDFADVDGDGLPDIITTTLSMESYAFFR